jgi:hypothetical protein
LHILANIYSARICLQMGLPIIEPDVPPTASGAPDAANESAWERGLRHAKEVTAITLS